MRILFDLDGTLSDPFVGITSCIQHALSSLGRNVPRAEELRWCIGPPLHESFLRLLETTDDSLADEAVERYRDRFGTVGLFENELYPEIANTLELLMEEGHTLSVATSKPEVFAIRIIDHFDLAQYFCKVDGSQLDGTRSDKTSLLGHILERDEIDHASAIMIGDRKHDIIGASENGILSIGVDWGHGTREELETAGANLISKRPADLPEDIASLRRR